MRQRPTILPVPAYFAALAATGGLALAAMTVLTSPDRLSAASAIEGELVAISERAEAIAAFERNLHTVRLDAPETRAIPFAGFLASASHLSPGHRIDLARHPLDQARLEVLEVKRITQSISVTRPAAIKMDLLLVKGRLLDNGNLPGEHIVTPETADADHDTTGRIVHLLFAVGAPTAPKPATLAPPPTHQSL